MASNRHSRERLGQTNAEREKIVEANGKNWLSGLITFTTDESIWDRENESVQYSIGEEGASAFSLTRSSNAKAIQNSLTYRFHANQ